MAEFTRLPMFMFCPDSLVCLSTSRRPQRHHTLHDETKINRWILQHCCFEFWMRSIIFALWQVKHPKSTEPTKKSCVIGYPPIAENWKRADKLRKSLVIVPQKSFWRNQTKTWCLHAKKTNKQLLARSLLQWLVALILPWRVPPVAAKRKLDPQ